MGVNLPKSRVMAGLQCLKRLYFRVRYTELEGEIDDKSRAAFVQGKEGGGLPLPIP
jgi:hypothetical protein